MFIINFIFILEYMSAKRRIDIPYIMYVEY